MDVQKIKGNHMESDVILKVDNIHFSYQVTPVTKDVSLTIRKGEIRAIIGPNGAGKSTILSLISGKNHPQRGKIAFKDKEITHMKPHQIRKLGISRSFQITNIFPSYTVYENVSLAVQGMMDQKYNFWRPPTSYPQIHEETTRLLEECNLSGVANVKAKELSYAEQRQIEIALSLAGNPELLLLDEPTAGLSVEESQSLARLVKRISDNHNLSVIFIEHDMDIVFSISDIITVLYYGEILVEDVPERIKANAKVQEVYLGT
ncbi:ABC transporter ATP-binding protein [Schinkia azotoformans]|uniref:ABC transporter ATP-binding protein n=1 Tax=Schinkia azotoformans TaxID=1454 RepID=UPI002DB83970|nr:ABC transporter ATP-binding protein [Schinkia azotoformans]MEC1721472.1 ABC transporter ATP-binding protein [Schinkia azotoformans]MED4415735.1 ABC transporter ATP-binding protein [Schinkia azotoformans]